MPPPLHATHSERVWYYSFRTLCVLDFHFPGRSYFCHIPLSFNELPYFTFTPEMLAFDPAGYSTKWYQEFFTEDSWQRAVQNSFLIAVFATLISTFLGTLAALGLSRPEMPFRKTIMALLISPMIVPLIISAAGMYFFYCADRTGLDATSASSCSCRIGHPFVIITVTATLGRLRPLADARGREAWDRARPHLLRGDRAADPARRHIWGALLAFITSFDEVVVVLFVGSVEQRTIPWKMFSGIREEIRPTILAVATLLVFISIVLLTMVELLRRRSERLRGIRS